MPNKLPLYIAAVLVGFSLNAKAEVITLEPQGGFGNLRQFYEIPNSADADISIVCGNSDPSPITVTVDGVHYSAADGCLPATDRVLYAGDGSWVQLTGAYHTKTVRVGSGRGQHTSTHYFFDGGTLTRPPKY